MSGGPLFAFSAIPITTDRVFGYVYVGAGANSKQEEGFGVQASLGADAIWRLRFALPPVLPTGTAKLRLVALANAVAGAAKVNPKWNTVSDQDVPSSATLNAEGTSTLTWAAGDADAYMYLDIPLDASTLVGSGIVVMDLTYETTGWTLAAISSWQAFIIWT